MVAAGVPLGSVTDVQRGVTPFKLSAEQSHAKHMVAFDGVVRRYSLVVGSPVWIRFDSTLAEPKPERYFSGPRVLLRELISRKFELQAAYTDRDFVTNKSMQSILAKPGGPPLGYILGVLNSRLMSWYFLQRSQVGQRDDFPKIVLKESRGLPIPWPAARETERVRRISEGSIRLQQLVEAIATAPGARKADIEKQAAALDDSLEQDVAALFGLTEDELKVVHLPVS